MVKLDCPAHPLLEEVTLIVATSVVDPLLTVTNGAMSPVPLAGMPMPGVLLDHVIGAGTVVTKAKAPVVSPGQKLADAGKVRLGEGLIVNCRITVVVPHSFVTDSDTECGPALVNEMQPGFA
jgi:hypothetical protein